MITVFSNHFSSCTYTMDTFPKHFTQWALQTHTSANPLTFGAKCTTTIKTLYTSPKRDSCCRNFNKCCHSKYNDLKITDNLKHCKMHILCVAVCSIFAQFSVALQKKRKTYDTSYT